MSNNTRIPHRESRSRLYTTWRNIKTRCYNPKTHNYKSYGGKGITLSDEWFDYMNFKEWAYNNGYREDLTIDRIDNNEGYYPENCRWVGIITQSRNRSNSRYITLGNTKKHAMEWCDIYGLDYQTYIQRVTKLGWSEQDALETPTSDYKYKDGSKEYVLYKGNTILMTGTIKGIAEKLGIPKYSVTAYGEPAYLERHKESSVRRKLRISRNA